MEFTKGYSKLDNDWFSKDGPLQYLTADEKILLIYLGTIIIMKSPLYEKCHQERIPFKRYVGSRIIGDGKRQKVWMKRGLQSRLTAMGGITFTC
jgi:hypothetical protein